MSTAGGGRQRAACDRLPRSWSAPPKPASPAKCAGCALPAAGRGRGALSPARCAAPPRRQQPRLLGLGPRGPRPCRALGAAPRGGRRRGALSRRPLPPRWRLPAAVLAAFAAGVALAGEPEAIVDASRYFVQAKHLALLGRPPSSATGAARCPPGPTCRSRRCSTGWSSASAASTGCRADVHRRPVRAHGARDGADRRPALGEGPARAARCCCWPSPACSCTCRC